MTDLLAYTETCISGPDLTDFGVTDEQGRRLGYAVKVFVRTYSPFTREYGSCVRARGIHQDGATVYRAYTTATKDGKKWGATTSDLYGSTLEEVNLLVSKRIEKARARYAKKDTAARNT